MSQHISFARRWTAVVAASVCALALVSCGSSTGTGNSASNSSNSSGTSNSSGSSTSASSSSGSSASSSAQSGASSSGDSGSGSGSDASSPSASASGGDSSAASTTVPKEKVTLTLAYAQAPDMIKGLTAAFHKKYPQVSFTLQETGFSQFIKSMKLLMSSDSAPDLVEYHPAQGLVKGSLITDLAPYEQAYGWDSSFPKSALDMLRVSKDGKKLGEGILTSIPAALSVVGVFYNKKMLKDAGVDSTPTTLADLEADFAKVKTAGMTPLTVGALDYGGLRLWGELLNVMTDHTKLTEWIDGKAGSDITAIQGVLDATDKMGQYVAKGYFPKSSSLGLSEADAATKFAQGSSVFLIDGNWAAAQLSTAMKDNVGFFLLPPVTAGEPAVANGSSISYAISSKSQHQVAAAAFLNFLGSAEAAKIEAIKGGFLPPNAAAAPKQSGVMGDLEVANTQIVKSNGLVPYPNDAAPAMIDSMVSGMQKLIADRMTGKDYIDSLQKVWTDYHGS